MISEKDRHAAALAAAVESLDPTIWGELRPDAPRQNIESAIAVYQAHLSEATVTVTMEDCRALGYAFLTETADKPTDQAMAAALRHIVPAIQIAGSEGPK